MPAASWLAFAKDHVKELNAQYEALTAALEELDAEQRGVEEEFVKKRIDLVGQIKAIQRAWGTERQLAMLQQKKAEAAGG